MNCYRILLLVILSVLLVSAGYADPVVVPSDPLIDLDGFSEPVPTIVVPSDRLIDVAGRPVSSPPAAPDRPTEGWTPPEVMVPGDCMRPDLHFDADGTAHLLWMSATDILHVVRDSSGWSVPDTLYASSDLVFKFGSDRGPDGELWYVFHGRAGGGRKIYAGHSESGVWLPPERIDPDDGFLHFSPNLAVGDDVVWVTWYSKPYHAYPTDHVLAVRGTSEGWGEPVKITAGMDGDHWFSDVAVDGEGRAHLVWGDSEAGLYYYVTSTDGISWSEPFAINPHLLGVYAAGWPGCSVVCDADGNVHVAWMGRRILDGGVLADWDIYYSTFDGQYWTSPQQVNVDNETADAYPHLTIGLEGEVWLGWMDGNPASLSEARTRCARSYDGYSWTEWRLDDDTHYFDSYPHLTIDPEGVPWAVWYAQYVNFTDKPGNIVGTHYDPSVPVRSAVVEGLGLESSAEIRWTVRDDPYTAFDIDRSGEAGREWIARVSAAGVPRYIWTDAEVAPGVWSYTVTGIDRGGRRHPLGSAAVEVGARPPGLVVRGLGRVGRGAYRLRIGSPAATRVSLSQFDVQGRLLAEDRDVHVTAGWKDLIWQPGYSRCDPPASGVYWIRARDGQGRTAVLRVVETPSP